MHFAIDGGFERAITLAGQGRAAGLAKYQRVFGDWRVLRAYEAARSEDEQQHLAKAYLAITGQSIEPRVNRLMND